MREEDKPPLAPVNSEIVWNNRTYKITDSPIFAGDLVWNEAAKSVDRCIAVFADDIIIEFLDEAMRACMLKERFQRLSSKYPKCIIVGMPAPNLLTHIQLEILEKKGIKHEDICFVKGADEITAEQMKYLQGGPLPALDFPPPIISNLEYEKYSLDKLKSHHNDKPWYARFDKKKMKRR